VEIEMEFPSASAREAFVIEAQNLPNWCGHPLICERDGSLDHDKGLECILSCYTSTTPLLTDAHALQACAAKHNAIAWDLPKLREREAGIHISTNRIGWNRRSLCRLGYIVTVCAEALAKAAGRKSTFAEFPPRLSLGYIMQYKPLAEFARGQRGKYCAVNVRDSRLEWRIFRSTLNPDRLTKNLALVVELEALAKGTIPAAQLKSAALSIISSHIL
jgi:hypothetical protein